MVVVAAELRLAVAAQLDRRRAAEFAAPDHQRVVEHAPLLQIGQQGGDRLVDLAGELAVIRFDVVVVVPRLAGAVPELHEAHAALEEPPGDQRLPAMHAAAIQVAHVLRLAGEVERLGRLGLHAEGQLERLNAGLEPRIGPARAGARRSASAADRAAAAAWRSWRAAADVLDQLVELLVLASR